MSKQTKLLSLPRILTEDVNVFVADFPANMYLVDKNLTICACSDLMAQTFGYQSAQEVVGMSVLDFPTVHLAPEVVDDCKQVFDSGKTVEGERNCLDCHGNAIVYLTKKVPMKDEQGNTYALLGVALDITAQKSIGKKNVEIERLKREDKSKEKYFKDILSVVPGLFYWKDLNCNYLGCNKHVSDRIGLSSEEEIVGLSDFDMPWTEQAEHYRVQDLQVIQTGKTGVFEDNAVDANGVQICWLTRKEPLRNEEGDIVGVIGSTIEVTAQKEKERLEREKAEQETQELKRRLEVEEEFHKIVLQANHDIGSPLLVLDLFAKKYLESAPEEQRNSVRNSISRIRGIASSMLGRFSDDSLKKNGDLLFPVLAEVISEKRVELVDSKINLIFNVDAGSYFAFFCVDLSAFKRMMSNIINNSADALLGILDREICIDVTCSHGIISIHISDNGCGMSESVKQKILNGVSITSGKQDGYGLGYLQIRQTVALLEGKLEIQSSEGQGTSILLTFPALKLPDYIASMIEPHPHDTIIVVDDDPSIHEAWDLRFTNTCCSIKHFTQAKEAVQYLSGFSEVQKESVCLLSDYELLNQSVNGIELIEKLKLRKSILVTSHHENPDVVEQVKKSGIKLLPKILAGKVPIVQDCDYKNCSNNVFKI